MSDRSASGAKIPRGFVPSPMKLSSRCHRRSHATVSQCVTVSREIECGVPCRVYHDHRGLSRLNLCDECPLRRGASMSGNPASARPCKRTRGFLWRATASFTTRAFIASYVRRLGFLARFMMLRRRGFCGLRRAAATRCKTTSPPHLPTARRAARAARASHCVAAYRLEQRDDRRSAQA